MIFSKIKILKIGNKKIFYCTCVLSNKRFKENLIRLFIKYGIKEILENSKIEFSESKIKLCKNKYYSNINYNYEIKDIYGRITKIIPFFNKYIFLLSKNFNIKEKEFTERVLVPCFLKTNDDNFIITNFFIF